jgi:hypothetical protein
VTTLKDFSDKEIEHCFPPNAITITLNDSNDFQKQVLDGYFLTLPDRSAELDKKELKLESHRTGSRDIKFNGLTVGAVVGDFPETGTLISGRVELVPGADSELKTFNGRVFTFDEEHHEDVFTGPATGLSSKIVVLPSVGDNGTIHLKQNFSKYEALPLRNSLCDDVEFGRVDYGEISPESVVVRVTKNVSEPLTGVYVLTKDNGFKLSVNTDNDIDFADGMVRISRKHDLYTYDLFCDDSGTTYTTRASVTPKLENRVIGDGVFDVISVHVGDDEIPSFTERTIVLERDDGFVKTITNTEGITSTISFNESDNTLRTRTPIKGLVTTKDYYVNKDVKTRVEQPRTRIVESQTIDLADPAYETAETDGEKGWDLEITEHTGKDYPPYGLTVNVDEVKQITLEFPKDDYDNTVSHEFIARISINGTTDFIKVNIADDVELDNRDRGDLFVKGNETSTIQFRQVGFKNGKPLYLVEDLKEHDLTHFIEELHKEIENRKTAVSEEQEARISADQILSARIDKNASDISDIYNRISGIINYKGVLNVNKNYPGEEGFAKMLEDNEKDQHAGLSAGWFYLIESDKDPLYAHYVAGVKVGKGDYLKIENSKRVEEILSSDVLILDTLDGDVVHINDLTAVSSDLNTKIETEKTNITNMSAYVDNLCVAISNDIISLDTRTSDNEEDISEISTKIEGIVNFKDVLTISGDLSTDSAGTGFYHLFLENKYSHDTKLSGGWIYLIKSETEPADNHHVDGVKVGSGDYMRIVKNVELSAITKDDVSIADIFDSDSVHYDCLSAISAMLSNDISTERGNVTNMSSYVEKTFVHLSGDKMTGTLSVTTLCADLVSTKSDVVDSLTAKDSTITNATIDNLTVDLSDLYFSDVEKKASDICSDIQSQITSNDTDIENITLSVGNLSGLLESTVTSCNVLNGRVDDLCSAISSDVIKLETKVNDLCSAISTDVIKLSGDFHDLADKTFLKPEDTHISSYYMVLTEESHDSDDDRKPHPQYYMTFRDGTLVLVKKEDSSEKKEDASEEKKEY